MVFTTAGGGASQLYPYEIDNSLRFNEQDDAKLSFDPDSAGNVDTMTISFWMKPDLNFGGDHNNIFSVRPSAGSYAMLVHRTGGEILFEHSGAGDILKTNRLFRDPSAWYHIVLALDSTNSTASLRARLYVNGIEETSFATDGRASHSQNTDFLFGGTNPHQISGDPTGNYFYGGYLADFYYVNGTQLAPTSFGETNDNGVWIPKAYGGSYGTNGFHLEFKETGTSQNSSGMGADTSGNDNHFAVTNLAATDVTTDTPTNNFATWNSIQERPGEGIATFAEGNTKVSGTSKHGYATIALPTSGKWYAEVKFTSGSSTAHLGLRDIDDYTADGNTDRLLFRNDANYDDGDHTDLTSYGSSWTNSIIGIAVNLDDNEVVFYKDGTAQNSGTAISHNASNQFIHAATAGGYSAEANFGNPPFAISSGNADANGYGNFEYAVPSGYYALCTKNLAEYG